MRIVPITLIAVAFMLVSGAASAGNFSFANGQSQWQSTRCTEPVEPPSLLSLNSETSASEVNALMETYNAYAGQMQQYMDCIGSEAQIDADKASQNIISSAQVTISVAQQKVANLHDTLQAKR